MTFSTSAMGVCIATMYISMKMVKFKSVIHLRNITRDHPGNILVENIGESTIRKGNTMDVSCDVKAVYDIATSLLIFIAAQIKSACHG
jgi:hypothetical protein